MRIKTVDRSQEVAGRAMRLHYEIAGLVSRYGALPSDVGPVVTQLFVDGVSVFTSRCRARDPSQRVQATAEMTRAFSDMQAAAAIVRPLLTLVPVKPRDGW